MTHRVLFMTYVYPPLAMVGTFRSVRFVKYLPEFGWTPLVVTATPKSLEGLPQDEGLMEHVPDGTVVRRASIWRPARRIKGWIPRKRSGRGGGDNPRANRLGEARNGADRGQTDLPKSLRARLKRFFSETGMLLMATPDAEVGWFLPACTAAIRLVRQHRPHVIYSTSPPHSQHLVAIAVGAVMQLPVVIDLRDPWARAPTNTGDESALRLAAQCRLEAMCVRRASGTILNTERLRQDFCEYYPPTLHDRFEVITNGYDPALQSTVEKLAQNQQQEPRDAVLRICHPGNIYGRRDILPLFEAIKKIADDGIDVRFEQIGLIRNTDPTGYLREQGIEHLVRLTNRRLSHRETMQRMSAADVLIVIRNNTELQVPAKAYEMLMFRKPIVALDDRGATSDFICRYDLGVVADPTQSASIADAIQRANQQKKTISAKAGWETALAEYDGRELTEKLATVLSDAIQRYGRSPRTMSSGLRQVDSVRMTREARRVGKDRP